MMAVLVESGKLLPTSMIVKETIVFIDRFTRFKI